MRGLTSYRACRTTEMDELTVGREFADFESLSTAVTHFEQKSNKTESLSVIVNRDAQKSLSEGGTTEDLWWKCNLGIIPAQREDFFLQSVSIKLSC